MTNLTMEDKILGRTKPLPKTDLELKAFTKEAKYLVHADGSDNVKTVTGVTVGRLLSLENKQKITNGVLEIKANGLVIKRIEENKNNDEEEVKETEKPKRKRTK